jgi:moderate conductance mechanosensitive channel
VEAIIRVIWVQVLAGAIEVLKIVGLYFLARFALFTAIGGMMNSFFERRYAGQNGAAAKRYETLKGLLRSVVSYLLFGIAAIMGLRAVGVDPLPVLTTAGVLGLAVGFGAQRLVRDVISGFFILLEDQFSVGEYVTLAGVTGTVQEIGMRISRIRDDAGKLNIIANGDITNVCNHSRGAVTVTVDISIASDADPDKVRELLNKAGEQIAASRKDVTAPLNYTGIVAMDAAKLTLRFSGACEARSSESVQMAARKTFRDALREAGVVIV